MKKDIELFLELNTYCNNLCIFCDNKEKKHKFVDIKNIKGIDELLDRATYVDITGTGEMTLHPDFFNILNYLTEKRVPIRMVTNGTMLNERVREAIVNSSISELVISVNSLNRENYKKLMGVDKLNEVLENIDELVKVYNKTLFFSFVMNAYNFDEVPSFIDFGKKYNKNIYCLGLTPTLKYTPDLIIQNTQENKDKIVKWREYASSLGVTFWIFNFDTQVGVKERDDNLSEKIKDCEWVYTKMFIDIDGNVTPCCWSKLPMGNIFEQSFNEIWKRSKYTQLRQMIKKGITQYCINCRKDG